MRVRPVVAAFLCASSHAMAQGTITGVVRDSLKRPVADVEVSIVSSERRVRTDSGGRFALGAVEAGAHTLRARRIGYFPSEKRIVVGDAPRTVEFVLDKRPIMLDTVKVTAACMRFEFAGFACRRRNAGGTGGVFFDVDAIDSIQPRFPVDVLREVPGFRVVANLRQPGLGVHSTVDHFCGPVVLANGKKPSLQNPLPIWPNETIGIEAYALAKDVPKEYKHFVDPPHGKCGIVIYWTSVRPRKTKSR